MRRLKISVQSCVVAFALVSLLFMQMNGFSSDPGVGWHLKTGEIIFHSGSVPHVDPFLAAESDRKWVCDQWLSDLIFYSLQHFGGWPLLYSLLVIVYLSTYCGILYFGAAGINRIGPSSWQISFLALSIAVLFAFKLGQVQFILRPVVLSFFAFAVVLVCLWRASARLQIESGKALWTAKHFIGLPVLFLVWANVHPGFILGLVLAALFVFGNFLDRMLFDRGIPSSAVLSSVLLLALCVLSTFINPFGVELHRSIFSLGSSGYFMNLHMEWQPIDVQEASGRIFMLIIAVISFAALFGLYAVKEIGSFYYLSLLMFGYLSLDAVRVAPYFGMVSIVPFALALASLGKLPCFSKQPLLAKLRQLHKKLDAREAGLARGKFLLAVIVLLLPAYSVIYGRLPLASAQLGIPEDKYPVAAAQFLLQQHRMRLENGDLSDTLVFSPPNWGGLITYYGYGPADVRQPRMRGFIDDRNTLIGEGFHRRVMAALSHGADWDKLVLSLQADYLLVDQGSAIAHILREAPERYSRFKVVYEDSMALVIKVVVFDSNNHAG